VEALGADIAAKPEAALESLVSACRKAVQEDSAEVVVLGGLGLAGLAGRIGDEVPVPVIDNVVASVRVAEAAATLGAAKAKSGSFAAATPVKTTGLSPALGALLEGREA
jgi:Asp/Glu/hydantoin racemase